MKQMKKTKIASAVIIFSLMMISNIPALAIEYTVDGADGGMFGKPTSVDAVTVIGGGITDADNVDRSKNSQIVPPSFGSPSADTPGTGELLTPNISGLPEPVLSPTWIAGTLPDMVNDGTIYMPPAEFIQEYSPPTYTVYAHTAVDNLYYTDGSIGTLSIPKLGLTVKTYEGETTANMAKGAAHFSSTSAWNGNAAFAAHNRGSSAYFGEIHTLQNGDIIKYTTKLGTRSYEVYSVRQIYETDLSCLGQSSENIITLVTCVRDNPPLRWLVQAKEV